MVCLERRDAMSLVESIIKLLTAIILLYNAVKPLFKRQDREKPPKV